LLGISWNNHKNNCEVAPGMTEQKLFAYLNIDHPMVAWEVAIGRLQSVGEITGERFGVSLWTYSMLQSYVQAKLPKRFANELRLEYVRMRSHAHRVSRLHGLYFFKSKEDALFASGYWGMPERRQYISAVQFFPSALTEVDSEWITFNLGSNDDSAWMDSYWSGATAGVRPLTEILATGQGIVLNKELRIQAYKRIYYLWPTATPLLAAVCCAFDRCKLNDLAVVKPGLVSKGDTIQGNYYIYMKQFDEHQSEIVAAMEDCQKAGDCPPVVMPSDRSKIFSLPNLSSFSFELHDPESRMTFASIHNTA
jgi:hypothetical protein